MPDRPTASTITDDQLDALYGQIDRIRKLGETLSAANTPDGSPSSLRAAGYLIAAILGNHVTEEQAA